MDQCGLRLNEWGELVPKDTESPHSFPPTTIGFQAIDLLAGLDPGVAEELHYTLVAWLWGEIWGTGSLTPLIATALSLSPFLAVGLSSPQSPYNPGKAKYNARSCRE